MPVVRPSDGLMMVPMYCRVLEIGQQVGRGALISVNSGVKKGDEKYEDEETGKGSYTENAEFARLGLRILVKTLKERWCIIF